MNKKNNLFVAMILLSFTSPAFAGPIIGGGPMTPLYRLVCHSIGAEYEIFVGFLKSNGTADAQILDVSRNDEAPKVLRKLKVRPELNQEAGNHEKYIGKDFSLDVDLDKRVEGGGGLAGTTTFTVKAHGTVTRDLGCYVYTQNHFSK